MYMFKFKYLIFKEMSINVFKFVQGEPFFTINKQTAASHIRVQDGETIVIGGLIETIERKAHRSVPLFSKIPILGLLFRSKQEEKQFDELMIFLTPHIVNGEKG